jgi:O-antigen ligase
MLASQILFTIRKVLLWCLVFTFVYGFLETLIVIFHIGVLRPVLALFDFFPFLDVNYPSVDRISSVAYESPALGNYLITVSGWMFSYILTEKNKYRFLPTLMVLFLTFFSGSRTALINVGLQLFILIYIMYSMKEYKAILLNTFKYTLIIAFIALIWNGQSIIKEIDKKAESLNFSKNLKNNVSNQSRFGMQYASLQVFKENPIIGVGFGQETYHKRKHYPRWAKNNNYEFTMYYENKNFKSFPTAYNLYTRLLAETGLIGILFWLYLIYLVISRSKLIWKTSKHEEKILGLILLISFSGLSLNWMQTDFFRQHGFWLCMAILIKLLSDRKEKSIKKVVISQP